MNRTFPENFVWSSGLAVVLLLAIAPHAAARTSAKAAGRGHGCPASIGLQNPKQPLPPPLLPPAAAPKPPELERAAEPAEAEAERSLSHGLWQHLLGSEPPSSGKKEKSAPKRRPGVGAVSDPSPSDASAEDGVTT